MCYPVASHVHERWMKPYRIYMIRYIVYQKCHDGEITTTNVAYGIILTLDSAAIVPAMLVGCSNMLLPLLKCTQWFNKNCHHNEIANLNIMSEVILSVNSETGWRFKCVLVHEDNMLLLLLESIQIAKFMGPTWGPPGSCRPQMDPMLAPWTLLSGYPLLSKKLSWKDPYIYHEWYS